LPSPLAIRRPLALASVFALGAGAVLSGSGPASASHPGAPGVLTASNGSATIVMNTQPVTRLTTPLAVNDANWSSDGSRVTFVDADGTVVTARFNDGGSIFPITSAAPPGVTRADPHWVGDGRHIVWASKSAGTRWRLELAVSGYEFDISQITPADGFHYLNPDTGADQRIVVQRQADSNGTPTGTPTIGIIEPGSPFRQIAGNAGNPSISPDGTRVAFVREVGGFDQIVAQDLDGGNPVQVTTNAVDHDNPTWHPSGDFIAFNQGSGTATDRVFLGRAGGQDAATPLDQGLTGVPAYRPQKRDRVVRLHGPNRMETAAAVSRSHWATLGTSASEQFRAESAVLSRSDEFADALGGTTLAAAKKGPLLMTPSTSLAPATQTELQRILAPGATVYLLGGTGAISTGVEDRIRTLGYLPRRLSGANRYETSVAIARAVAPTPDFVLAATGMDFPDALAAGTAAGAYNTDGSGMSAVVVLTNNATLSVATEAYLNSLPEPWVFGIGNHAATATARYGSFPVYGDSRYQTALATAWTFFAGQHYVGVATGTDWPDALAGGALMGRLGGPLMLTPGASPQLGPDAAELFNESSGSVHTGLIFGGTGVVNAGQQDGIGEWSDGWPGYEYLENPSEDGPGARANSTDRGLLTPGAGSTEALRRTPAELKKAAAAAQERLGN